MASGYPVVRQKLIDIISATEPDHNTSHIYGRFYYLEQGMSEEFVASRDRGFYLSLTGGNAELPGCYRGKGRMMVTCQLMVMYSSAFNLGAIDEIMGSDAENIIEQLLTTSNWDRANTKIELIGGRDGNITTMPFEIGSLDEQTDILTFSFPVIYSRGQASNLKTE